MPGSFIISHLLLAVLPNTGSRNDWEYGCWESVQHCELCLVSSHLILLLPRMFSAMLQLQLNVVSILLLFQYFLFLVCRSLRGKYWGAEVRFLPCIVAHPAPIPGVILCSLKPLQGSLLRTAHAFLQETGKYFHKISSWPHQLRSDGNRF